MRSGSSSPVRVSPSVRVGKRRAAPPARPRQGAWRLGLDEVTVLLAGQGLAFREVREEEVRPARPLQEAVGAYVTEQGGGGGGHGDGHAGRAGGAQGGGGGGGG